MILHKPAQKFKALGSQALALRSDTALVVIDSQYMFCTNRPNNMSRTPDTDVAHVERTLDQIAHARDFADASSIPTFLVYLVHNIPNDIAIPFGTGDYGLYRQRLSGLYELAVKPAQSAFQNSIYTDIEPELPKLLTEYAAVKNLIFTGFSTDMCVKDSARDAMKRGYKVGVLSDCTANRDRQSAGREHYTLATLQEQGAWIASLNEWRSNRKKFTPPDAARADRPARQGSLTPAG